MRHSALATQCMPTNGRFQPIHAPCAPRPPAVQDQRDRRRRPLRRHHREFATAAAWLWCMRPFCRQHSVRLCLAWNGLHTCTARRQHGLQGSAAAWLRGGPAAWLLLVKRPLACADGLALGAMPRRLRKPRPRPLLPAGVLRNLFACRQPPQAGRQRHLPARLLGVALCPRLHAQSGLTSRAADISKQRRRSAQSLKPLVPGHVPRCAAPAAPSCRLLTTLPGAPRHTVCGARPTPRPAVALNPTRSQIKSHPD